MQTMTLWQQIRFWSALTIEMVGWLFVTWAVTTALPLFINPDQALNALGLLVGLANGFLFLLTGSVLMLSVRRCLSETLFLIVTLPAFATCAILVSFYLYAFSG